MLKFAHPLKAAMGVLCHADCLWLQFHAPRLGHGRKTGAIEQDREHAGTGCGQATTYNSALLLAESLQMNAELPLCGKDNFKCNMCGEMSM